MTHAVTVVIPSYLQRFAGGADRVDVAATGQTVADVLRALGARHPGVRDRVLTEQGELREHVSLFVGTDNVRFGEGLASPIRDGDEVTILGAVSGG